MTLLVRPYLARQLFRHYGRKKSFRLINAHVLCSLKNLVKGKVQYSESICNAGLLRTSHGYTCVAKNQRFSYCDELDDGHIRGLLATGSDDGERALYRIDFDHYWRMTSIRKLKVILSGTRVHPAIFIEDIRLIMHQGSSLAVANGNGAWPLLGTLDKDALSLRPAVAAFSPPEKNWMPFEFDNRIYLEYSIDPHVILAVDPNTAACTEIYRTQMLPHVFPNTVHGGAPSLRLSDDYFLGVGNSQHLYWFQERYYAAVFYLFEAKPPFRVVKASSPTRVSSRSGRIQYICGMTLGEDKTSVTLSMGVCDCDNRFVTVSLNEILALMQS